jgi:integrase
VLRNALNVAIGWDLVSRNVATLADPPKAELYTLTILTPEQAYQFLDAAKVDRLEALYWVVLSLGLREGEVLGLRWQDVDFNAGTVRVAVALQLINGKRALVKPKTQRSQRMLHVPPSLMTALHEHRARQLEERLIAGSQWNDHGLVFPTTIGTPMYPRNLIRAFHALLHRTGLLHMRFHDLRHSYATFSAIQGLIPRRQWRSWTCEHLDDPQYLYPRTG